MTRSKSHELPQFSADCSFPHLLVRSMLGTVASLACVWLVTAHLAVHTMVA